MFVWICWPFLGECLVFVDFWNLFPVTVARAADMSIGAQHLWVAGFSARCRSEEVDVAGLLLWSYMDSTKDKFLSERFSRM